MKKTLIFGFFLLVLCNTCKTPVRYSDIPEIKFISFETINQTEGLLVFYFQDGAGDIGLNNEDTYPPFDTASMYHSNFFCDYYEKKEGVFVKIDSVETPNGTMILFNLNARIPRLSNLQEESIHGEIYHKISPQYFDKFSPYNDTIQLKFYIVDRKLNKSNTQEVVVIR